jgi:hypothetical protein
MADLWINIEYWSPKPVDGPRVVIRTNVKHELAGDVLETWILDQQGLGADDRKAVERGVYHISFVVDLSDDSIVMQSDTGNDSLTCGIVMDVFARLDQPGEVEFR